MRGHTLPYVSRGGLKLEKAMTHFGVKPEGKVCMDVGASTGGFTDCMLQNGAVKVYAVDVGQGQLAWKLRNDPRVVCMEKTNIRYVKPEDIGDRIALASIDVSFISLTKVLGPVKELLTPDGQIVCLIKPQFEAGREKVGKERPSGGHRNDHGLRARAGLFPLKSGIFPDQGARGQHRVPALSGQPAGRSAGGRISRPGGGGRGGSREPVGEDNETFLYSG